MSGPTRPRRRVAVVDDNAISLNGHVVSLAAHPLIDVIAAVDHGEALRWGDAEWNRLDAVVVDAARPFDDDNRDRESDNFPGVAVVVRAREGRPDLLIIVVTGRFFEDGLRRRMKEAGADFFYFRDHLRAPQQLQRAVLEPELCRAGVPDVQIPMHGPLLASTTDRSSTGLSPTSTPEPGRLRPGGAASAAALTTAPGPRPPTPASGR